MTGWIYLGIAILFEVVATLFLKLSNGFEKPMWVAASIGMYSLCFLVFALALRAIPVSVAYAIWAGIGIVAISILGFMFFDERLSWLQGGFIAMIVIGAVGLRVTTST